MEKILIAGAAGSLGSVLVSKFLQAGYTVIALDRNTSPLKNQPLQPAEMVNMDLTHPQNLETILHDVDAVITTVGIGKPNKLSDYWDVDYNANLNLLNAAIQAGVKKFVYTSVVKVNSDLSVPLLKAKLQFELILTHSPIDWLVIRPSGYFSDIWRTFMQSAIKGKMTLVKTKTEYRFSPVDPADVAEWLVNNLDLSHQHVRLGGPQDFTYQEITELCFELLNKPVKISWVPLPIFDGLLFVLRRINPPLYGVMSFLRWASTTDLTAPAIGNRNVRDYLSNLLKQTNG